MGITFLVRLNYEKKLYVKFVFRISKLAFYLKRKKLANYKNVIFTCLEQYPKSSRFKS